MQIRKPNLRSIQISTIFISVSRRDCGDVIAPHIGPALESAGPDWKHFCGAPFSGKCRNFLELSSHNGKNHE